MIKGIPVTLHERIKVGVDDFNAPIYEETTVVVENVLVAPAEHNAVVNNLQLYGRHTAYKIGIPKGDAHDWEDATVEFFGKRFRVFGSIQRGIDDLVPLSWNRNAFVEVYE